MAMLRNAGGKKYVLSLLFRGLYISYVVAYFDSFKPKLNHCINFKKVSAKDFSQRNNNNILPELLYLAL